MHQRLVQRPVLLWAGQTQWLSPMVTSDTHYEAVYHEFGAEERDSDEGDHNFQTLCLLLLVMLINTGATS